MINEMMYAHPNGQVFTYQSLLRQDSSFSTEALNVEDIDYFINFLIAKNLISKDIFSRSRRDEYLREITSFLQEELSETRLALSKEEVKGNRQVKFY